MRSAGLPSWSHGVHLGDLLAVYLRRCSYLRISVVIVLVKCEDVLLVEEALRV